MKISNEIDINDIHFSLKNQNGEEVQCDILFEAIDDINKKVYIAYTDYIKDENGKNRIVLAELVNNGEGYFPIPIEDPDIKDAIKEQLNKMQE